MIEEYNMDLKAEYSA